VLVPGFIDGHTHVVGVGEKMRRIPLEGVRTIPELLTVVRDRAGMTPPGEWILGNGEFEMFHERQLAEGRLPTLQEMNDAAPAHPVWLTRGDDAALVNGQALRRVGVDPAAPGAAPAPIVRDAAGRPTGFVAGKQGLLLFRPVLPVFAPEDRSRIIREMAARFHAAGVTSVVDCGLIGEFDRDWAAYRALRADGAFRLRVNLMVRLDTTGSLADTIAQIRALPIGYGDGDAWLRVGTLKLIYDGEISTAWMRVPYPGRPGDFGVRWFEPQALREILRAAERREWPMAIHTMGGAAIDSALDAIGEVFPTTYDPRARHSLMHAFFPSPANLRAAKAMNIILSMHPLIFHVYGRSMVREWGPALAAAANPLRDVLASGAPAGGGTDMIPFDPLLSMWTAVTRITKAGDCLGPEQAITPAQALWLHTVGAAAITGEEHRKGSIEPGKLADFTVLSDDPLEAPSDAIKDIRVLMTIVGGHVVHQADA
jgi:hypothetical protein